jgi:hypothetical protein
MKVRTQPARHADAIVRSRYYSLMVVSNLAWHPLAFWLFLTTGVFSRSWFAVLYAASVLITLVFFLNPMSFSVDGSEFTARWIWGRKRAWPADQVERRRARSLAAILGGFEELAIADGTTFYIWPQFLADFDALEEALKRAGARTST